MITGLSKYSKIVYVCTERDSSIRVAYGAFHSSPDHTIRQSGEQPSPSIEFPSSHTSPGLISPSPHIGLHTVSTALPVGLTRLPL